MLFFTINRKEMAAMDNLLSTKKSWDIGRYGQIGIAVALLFASGCIRYDFSGVPFTMQSQAVLLIAMCYPRELALRSVAYYVLLWMGLMPFLGGFPTVFGATFGYLMGFLIATLYVNRRLNYSDNGDFSGIISAGLGAQLIIWGCGYLWLVWLLDMTTAFYVGVVPFVVIDLIKLASVLAIVKALKR